MPVRQAHLKKKKVQQQQQLHQQHQQQQQQPQHGAGFTCLRLHSRPLRQRALSQRPTVLRQTDSGSDVHDPVLRHLLQSRLRLRQGETERDPIRTRMIYSFRPLPLMKGCRWMTYHLTVHSIIIPMSKKINKLTTIDLTRF